MKEQKEMRKNCQPGHTGWEKLKTQGRQKLTPEEAERVRRGHLGEHREGPGPGPVLGRLRTNGKGSERKKKSTLGLGLEGQGSEGSS